MTGGGLSGRDYKITWEGVVVRFRMLLIVATCFFVCSPWAAADFVNFETPHVHPIDISPDGNTLAVCNTPDNRIEVYDLGSGTPVHTAAIPVGIDPVSVRFRNNTEAWVVNHISDTVSVVDLSLESVVATVFTLDEPCDVVFAGTTERAFVSCSQ